MEIVCPKCGADNWLENQSRCLRCGAVLRRCVDCDHYDAGTQTCTNLGTDVGLDEAEDPTALSLSTNCTGFRCLR